MTKNKKAEEIAFSRCDVPERTKRFALQYVSEAYAGIKNCRECEFYNTCDRIDSVRAELRKKKKEGMKNMTEQETREKIVEVLKKSREEWEIITPSIGILDEPRVDIEIDKLAAALIVAGIGDVSELKKHRVQIMKDGTIQQFYSGKEVEQIVKERDEYKHRALVAEKALKIATELGELCAPVEDYIKQAEKELAEEGKDD